MNSSVQSKRLLAKRRNEKYTRVVKVSSRKQSTFNMQGLLKKEQKRHEISKKNMILQSYEDSVISNFTWEDEVIASSETFSVDPMDLSP